MGWRHGLFRRVVSFVRLGLECIFFSPSASNHNHSIIEPNLSGQRLGISPLVLLLTVMVSASVWGISGAIIGVPIMIIARIALEEDERTRPIALMLAKEVHEEE